MSTVSQYRGDDWAIALTISETIAGVTTPFNLTGATITSTVGGTPGWTGTPVVIDALTGKIEIQVPAATTALFAPGAYDVDVQVVKSGIKRTPITFKLLVNPDVTRT
jgi:hypothetical protein